MLGRFVCTADENAAVIMQVQFPRVPGPGSHVVLRVSGHKEQRKRQTWDCFKLRAFITGQLLSQGQRRRLGWLHYRSTEHVIHAVHPEPCRYSCFSVTLGENPCLVGFHVHVQCEWNVLELQGWPLLNLKSISYHTHTHLWVFLLWDNSLEPFTWVIGNQMQTGRAKCRERVNKEPRAQIQNLLFVKRVNVNTGSIYSMWRSWFVKMYEFFEFNKKASEKTFWNLPHGSCKCQCSNCIWNINQSITFYWYFTNQNLSHRLK